MVRTLWCGTCLVRDKLYSRTRGRGRLQSLGYAVVMALKTSGDSCPSPLGLGMVLLPWLADEDLLGPAGAELGSLVAEEEGCNEDG